MQRIFTLVCLFVTVMLGGNAQGQEDYERKLDAITRAAAKLCESVPLNQVNSDLTWTASGKAELSGILKTLTNAGIDGAAKFERGESFGVLQKDLAGAIKDGNDCRSKIGDKLIDRLLSELNEPLNLNLPLPKRLATTVIFQLHAEFSEKLGFPTLQIRR